jgi:nucleoside-diphosphate-sugar epimerase
LRRALKKENAKQRMKPTDKIYVAGHSGLVGSAVVRLLKTRGFGNLITRSRSEVDLRDERAVRDLFTGRKTGTGDSGSGEGRWNQGQY